MTWNWAITEADLCAAPLLMSDDHWGAITQRCDLVAGHDGDHAAELRACIPVAVLTWPQNPRPRPHREVTP